MATPITSVDSPNIVAITNNNVYNITGSAFNQADIDYLLSPKYSFTGSLNLADNTVEFGYGILVAPPLTGSATFPTTTKQDFQFYLNGVRIDDDQVLGFIEDMTNTQSTASFNLGYPIRSYDVVTGVGKFKV
jgi:hypothetical protein